MLTKEEREEIAKRFKSCTKVDFSDIYRGLFGRPTPKETTIGEDDKATLNRLLDLCDTSNMLELPRDKDGEVIRPGDTIYDVDSKKYKVIGYMTNNNTSNIVMETCGPYIYTRKPGDSLTHKDPVTIDSLVKRIKNILHEDNNMPDWLHDELSLIASQLKSLGDSND